MDWYLYLHLPYKSYKTNKNAGKYTVRPMDGMGMVPKLRSIGKELVRRHAFEMVEKELEPGAQAWWYMPGTGERSPFPTLGKWTNHRLKGEFAKGY